MIYGTRLKILDTPPCLKAGDSWFDNHCAAIGEPASYTIFPSVNFRVPHGIFCIFSGRPGFSCQGVPQDIILGDLNQIDTSKLSRYSNGLSVCSDRMRGSKYVAQISYLDTDVKRSKLAKDAVERFRRV